MRRSRRKKNLRYLIAAFLISLLVGAAYAFPAEKLEMTGRMYLAPSDIDDGTEDFLPPFLPNSVPTETEDEAEEETEGDEPDENDSEEIEEEPEEEETEEEETEEEPETESGNFYSEETYPDEEPDSSEN
ncbi:MAG: hypothetical protein FWD19_02060 [Defluviitaleaceae bacterium]|nr:hypothetical protein [Defluviitaleaceae bacterium]